MSNVGNPSRRGVSVTAGVGHHPPPENHSQIDLSIHGRSGNTASTSQVFQPQDGSSSSLQSQQQQRYAVEWEHREGMGDRFVAGESALMQADVAPPEMGVILVPLTGDQLTLAFKGEVYLFDCVSQEKVQAVLLLLGGRELTSVVAPVQSYTQYKNMNPNIPQRATSLMRFREKKKEQSFNKKIHHNGRKKVEQRSERYKDQFLRAPKSISEASSSVTNLDATHSWGVRNGCLQASNICRRCHLNAISTPVTAHNRTGGARNLCDTCGIMCSNKGTISNSEENANIPPRPQDHSIPLNEENPGNRPSAEQSLPVDITNAQAQPS